MSFKAKYTTQTLIAADKDNIEKDKIVIADDTYAMCEILDHILKSLNFHRPYRK